MDKDPRYNWVYTELVNGPNDVRGAWAYALYKQEKIAFIEDFLKNNDNRPPTDEDLLPFHRMTSLPGRLDSYREKADSLLEDFFDATLANELAEYKEEVRNDVLLNQMQLRDETIRKHMELRDEAIRREIKPSFTRAVFQNVVAGIVTTMMAFGFVMATWMYNEGASNILVRGFFKYLNADSQATPPGRPASSPDSPNK